MIQTPSNPKGYRLVCSPDDIIKWNKKDLTIKKDMRTEIVSRQAHEQVQGFMQGIKLLFCTNLLPLLLAALVLSSCATVPVTGRKQLTLVPESELLAMSSQEYKQFLKKHKLCTNPAQVNMVRRVGNRIKAAVERFMFETGQASRLRGYHWEFNLICDKQINAWCMPGGKVVVYSGLLPVAKDDTGLAVVLGHEIAHAVANHGAERLSQQLLLQMGGEALSAFTGSYSPATRRLLFELYGLGANVGLLLPYSRTQEYEADHLGLIFMAMAGYDPRAALNFWQRMMKAARGKAKPPEFLSTHPSDQARLRRLEALMPEAMRYYQRYLYEHSHHQNQKKGAVEQWHYPARSYR